MTEPQPRKLSPFRGIVSGCCSSTVLQLARGVGKCPDTCDTNLQTRRTKTPESNMRRTQPHSSKNLQQNDVSRAKDTPKERLLAVLACRRQIHPPLGRKHQNPRPFKAGICSALLSSPQRVLQSSQKESRCKTSPQEKTLSAVHMERKRCKTSARRYPKTVFGQRTRIICCTNTSQTSPSHQTGKTCL